MAIHHLTHQEALRLGADVWFLTYPQESKWAQRLDWNLDFQLVRAWAHGRKAIPTELLQVANETEFEIEPLEIQAGAPLMVASHKLLPNRMTVVVPWTGDAKVWAVACEKIWRNLGAPRARVFLPENCPAQTFDKLWADEALEVVMPLVS